MKLPACPVLVGLLIGVKTLQSRSFWHPSIEQLLARRSLADALAAALDSIGCRRSFSLLDGLA